jgi:hypothetical protein
MFDLGDVSENLAVVIVRANDWERFGRSCRILELGIVLWVKP